MNLKKIFNGVKTTDFLIFAVLIIISSVCILITKQTITGNNNVYVEVDGKLSYVLSIDENRIISVKGIIGYTQIEIKNKMVRVIDSPCKNKDCIKQGWINKGTIICLPNRVFIRIGNEEKDIIDGITG